MSGGLLLSSALIGGVVNGALYGLLGLAIVMIGAILTHARRKEPQQVVVNVVLLVLAAVVAWARFGPYAL